MSHSVPNGQLNLSTASIRDSTFERSQRSEFSLMLVTVRSALAITIGQRSANVLRQCLSICGLSGEGRKAD